MFRRMDQPLVVLAAALLVFSAAMLVHEVRETKEAIKKEEKIDRGLSIADRAVDVIEDLFGGSEP
jgi:hypothetical protein